MRGPAVNCDVLGLFLAFQQTDILGLLREMLIKIRVINRINSLNEALILVVWRVHQPATDKPLVL